MPIFGDEDGVESLSRRGLRRNVLTPRNRQIVRLVLAGFWWRKTGDEGSRDPLSLEKRVMFNLVVSPGKWFLSPSGEEGIYYV
ncbi:MAG: hypothetical protein LBU15_00365 [Rickettsiales bacterium]|jgi:hypothetical protein|nr:hypothetical protein [Rickettsiales bacterium]